MLRCNQYSLPLMLICALSLSACGPAPNSQTGKASPSPASVPSPQTSQQTSPAIQPRASATAISSFSLSGQLEDLLPTYAAAPQLEFISQQTHKVYQAKVNPGKGYGGYYCSDAPVQVYPEVVSNDRAGSENYQMDYQISGLPLGESFDLKVSYPDQQLFRYDLSQQKLTQHKFLNLSLKHGLHFDQDTKPSQSEIYFKVTSSQGLSLQAASVKAHSLDPQKPYDVEITDVNAGVLFAVPANIPLEITTDIPNRQPSKTLLKTPASTHSYAENDLQYPGFEVATDSQKVYKHLLLQAQQPSQNLVMKTWKLNVINALAGSKIRIKSLDPLIVFNTERDIPTPQTLTDIGGQQVKSSQLSVSVPGNTPLQIEADFDGQPGFNGVLKPQLMADSAFTQSDQTLAVSSNAISGYSAPANPGLAIRSCSTLSVIEKTMVSGKITLGNQPTADANVTLRAIRSELDSRIYRIVTGSDGLYVFNALSAGIEYELNVEKNGLKKSRTFVLSSNKQGDPKVNVYDVDLQ